MFEQWFLHVSGSNWDNERKRNKSYNLSGGNPCTGILCNTNTLCMQLCNLCDFRHLLIYILIKVHFFQSSKNWNAYMTLHPLLGNNLKLEGICFLLNNTILPVFSLGKKVVFEDYHFKITYFCRRRIYMLC